MIEQAPRAKSVWDEVGLVDVVGSFEIGTGSIIDSQEEFPGEWPQLELHQ